MRSQVLRLRAMRLLRSLVSKERADSTSAEPAGLRFAHDRKTPAPEVHPGSCRFPGSLPSGLTPRDHAPSNVQSAMTIKAPTPSRSGLPQDYPGPAGAETAENVQLARCAARLPIHIFSRL